MPIRNLLHRSLPVIALLACSTKHGPNEAATGQDAMARDAAVTARDASTTDAQGPDADAAPRAENNRLRDDLEDIRKNYGLPALAALELQDGKVVREAAVGLRRLGGKDSVTVADAWHLGSCTKAMTSALTALAVEKGLLTWETPLSKIFDEPEIDAAMGAVTIRQLLVHQGGLPEDGTPTVDIISLLSTPGSPRAARAAIATTLLARAPVFTPGAETHYANFGVVLVGAALERLYDRAWEDLMQEQLFQPLAMNGCGFGAPDVSGQAPTGHIEMGSALLPQPGLDNPPLLGPAGTVHCPLRAWARFVDYMMAPPASGPLALSRETLKGLREGSSDGLAPGWILTTQPWATGTVWTHAGSNTSFFAVVWAVPQERRALFAVTNAGNAGAMNATNDAIIRLVSYGP
jgi:CubicO group peptidase (beta-lactamase class C family)